MNAARLKWFVLMAAFVLAINFVSGHRTRSVREYATSAQLYWQKPPQAGNGLAGGSHSNQAIVVVTTAAEVRNEGIASSAVRKLRELARLSTSQPELHLGGRAHLHD